ncbi:MAG: hypothetical protein MUC57_15795, partial [Desulfobacterales bacterium]|nr:hypothetical protein [Desulfobacterales bacterium]
MVLSATLSAKRFFGEGFQSRFSRRSRGCYGEVGSSRLESRSHRKDPTYLKGRLNYEVNEGAFLT